jgi:rhamnosyltransferase
MKASIICPTFNGGVTLKKSLKAILNQKFDQPYEIIFVDSSSTDGTARFLHLQSKIYENIHLFHINKSAFGHGKTRNYAISKSSGDLIILLTQDAIPANEHWLGTLVSTLEINNIAGAFGRHIAHSNHPKLIQKDLDNHFNQMNKIQIRKIEDWNTYKNDESLRQNLHFFSNNNSGLKRNIWEKMPFPNIGYGEDQVWARTVIEEGYALAYQNSSIVYHSHNFNLKNMKLRHAIEVKYFAEEFGYDIRIPRRHILTKLIKNLVKDFLWLFRNKYLHPKEFMFSIKKNITMIS